MIGRRSRRGPSNEPTDLFSFGAVLYEMSLELSEISLLCTFARTYNLPASGLLILLIDRPSRSAYFVGNLGGNPMKLLRWTIAALEISFVCFASIVPRVDDPATAFDETDSPVCVATPLATRTNLVLRGGHSVAIRIKQLVRREPCTTIYQLTPEPGSCSSHSLLYLLCKLLC